MRIIICLFLFVLFFQILHFRGLFFQDTPPLPALLPMTAGACVAHATIKHSFSVSKRIASKAKLITRYQHSTESENVSVCDCNMYTPSMDEYVCPIEEAPGAG